MSEVISRPWPASERRNAHMFGEDISVPCRSPHGKAQKDRTCAVCGTVMVTVFGRTGVPAWREWRLAGSEKQFEGAAPPCLSTVQSP